MQDEYGNFQNHLTGFVIDVSPNVLSEVKSAIVEVIQNHVDLAYISTPENLEVPPKKGISISQVLNYSNEVLDLGSAMRQAIYTMNHEDHEDHTYRKTLFIIVDELDPSQEYNCKKAVCADREKEIDKYFIYFKDNGDFSIDGVNYSLVNNLKMDLVSVINPDYEWAEIEEKPKEKVKEKRVYQKPKEITAEKKTISLEDFE